MVQYWSAHLGVCQRSVLSTCINRAAQQRASLQSFADYPVQISGSPAELIHFRHATCEVLKAFGSASSRQRLIGAIQSDRISHKNTLVHDTNDIQLPMLYGIQIIYQLGSEYLLGISLLQKCTPEFIALSWVDKHELSIFDGQSVIYHNIHPFAELPELQTKAIIKNSVSCPTLNRKVSGKRQILNTWKWKIPA